ncbi:MAG: M23 family metallopeptidase [Ruminococcus sp.]|nr:M23 family metallopeptidase [Ruminococcus sp.]
MKKPDLTRIRKLLSGKGLWVAAAACLIAVGGAGAAAYNKAVRQINDGINYSAPKVSESSKPSKYADEKVSSVPKDEASVPDTLSDDPSSEDMQSGPGTDIPISQPNVMPVNGEIIQPFSFGELVRSETLGVWKTHDGVDIKADKGTPVKAMNHGEVSRIWEDPLWGSCISIEHGTGIESFYYSLSPSMTVAEGDTVEAGQTIGMVGDTAQIEAAEPSHLHFAVKRNNEWIDPIGYIDPLTNK